MHLVVGLGNPGSEYAGTRHNVGFDVVDRLGQRHQFVFRTEPDAAVAKGEFDGRDVGLVKPLTFMNRSGQAVARIAREWNVALSDLLVVQDDVDLPVGRLRFRRSGSAGGHRGIASVIGSLADSDFPRLKIGVGRPNGDTVAHVLAAVEGPDRERLNEAVERAADAAEIFVRLGADVAMNRFNRAPEEGTAGR